MATAVPASLQRRASGAQVVVTSLDAEGLLAVIPEGRWRAAPPAHVRGNPTGAGDSAVAGLLSGLVEHLPWPDRLTRAVALSAATVRAPAAGEFDPGAYEELRGRVAVSGVVSAA
ncbi:PfkB family carbohydrate kinase [Streptomyces sp. NPDC101165]|uniref:PfkB family carbohydrate kinase n=1 Tax=Streptomyces sp. NPDC101165 TaxID=3366119 RepID=UPI003829B833